MSKSSINFQTAKSNSSSHMKRDSFVSYLIEHDNNHFEYKHYQDPKEYLEYAQVQTKLLTKRSMQSSAIKNFTQEAVLNIKKDTTIQDVENLFKTYNKEFKGGFKVFEIALHKDEGVFVDTKHDVDDLVFDSKTLKIYKDGIDVSNEVIAYAPNKDIFYNPDNKKWYKEKGFENEFDTSNLQKKMNYHAHISFTKWEELTGKNVRLQKSDLQKIQTITAQTLGMERGEKNSQTKRLNHYQIKSLQSEVNSQKVEHRELKLVTVPQLKAEIAIVRAELKEAKAPRADYAALEQLSKDLTARVAAKDLTIQEQSQEIEKLKKELSDASKTVQAQKTTIDTQKDDLSRLKQDMSDLTDNLVQDQSQEIEKLQKHKKSMIDAFKKIDSNCRNETEAVNFVDNLKKELLSTLEDKKELKIDNESLKSSLSDSSTLIERLQAIIADLKSQVESLNQQLSITKQKSEATKQSELVESSNDSFDVDEYLEEQRKLGNCDYSDLKLGN